MDTYWRGNFDETGTIIMGASKHGNTTKTVGVGSPSTMAFIRSNLYQ